MVLLTQQEAQLLLEMLKKTVNEAIGLPNMGKTIEFDVISDNESDLFKINIYRGKIDSKKINFGARIEKNNILLLELHIDKTIVHENPNGQKIYGSHWHVYHEKYGRKMAYPADDILSEDFVENTLLFLEKFKVVNSPTVLNQVATP